MLSILKYIKIHLSHNFAKPYAEYVHNLHYVNLQSATLQIQRDHLHRFKKCPHAKYSSLEHFERNALCKFPMEFVMLRINSHPTQV